MYKFDLKNGRTVALPVLTAVAMKSSVFSEVTPYSVVEVYSSFGEIYCFHSKSNASKQSARRRAW
jgi:hypothetical protein